ncbi:Fanconi anemia group A protein homolog [Saccoglossus kowalevskii]
MPKRPHGESDERSGFRKTFRDLVVPGISLCPTSTDTSVLKDAVLQLVNHHQGINELLQEAALDDTQIVPLSLGIQDCDVIEKEINTVKVNSESSALISAIKNRSQNTSSELCNQSPAECAQFLHDMIMKQQKQNGDNRSILLLSKSQRRIVQTLFSVMVKLSSQQAFSKKVFIRQISMQCGFYGDSPLELLWKLQKSSLMALDSFMTFSLEIPNVIANFTQSLTEICWHGNKDDIDLRREILSESICVSDISSLLIDYGYREKDGCTSDSAMKGLQKACTTVLHSVVLILDIIGNVQSKWTYAKTPRLMTNIYRQILLIMDSVMPVMQILRRIIERADVNWKILLSFIATFLVYYKDAVHQIKDWIHDLLRESFEENDQAKLQIAFVLGRHLALEGAHIFPSYSMWFKSCFGDDSSSLANNKKSFTFLMKFLTELMPKEPTQYLKSHIFNPPYIVPKCRPLYMDYITLAKTRLEDLKDPIEGSSIFSNESITDKYTKAQKEQQAVQDVEKAVTAYEKNNKIPSSVLEASIFRKPYFLGRFLTALLKPRMLPDVPDGKMRFIEALKRADKIPTSLLHNYTKACEKELKSLLEGVFSEESMEDDLEPLDGLKHSLDRLADVIMKSTHTTQEDGLSAHISIISEKIQNIIEANNESKPQQPEEFELDLTFTNTRRADVNPYALQLVDIILNGFGKVLTRLKSNNVDDTVWCSRFITMLSSHRTLHPALYTKLYYIICKQVCL